MERQMITWIAIVGVIVIAFLIRVVEVLWALNKKHHFIETGSEEEMFGVSNEDDDDDYEFFADL